MKGLMMGCALVGLIALTAKSEAMSSVSAGLSPLTVAQEAEYQIGLASWYGEEADGNTTANGETYDLNGLTAAHPTLPFGTTVRITNLKNSKKILLRINDRGPNVEDRLIDVSWEAARRLGFVSSGTTPVRVEVVTYPKWYLSASMSKINY